MCALAWRACVTCPSMCHLLHPCPHCACDSLLLPSLQGSANCTSRTLPGTQTPRSLQSMGTRRPCEVALCPRDVSVLITSCSPSAWATQMMPEIPQGLSLLVALPRILRAQGPNFWGSRAMCCDSHSIVCWLHQEAKIGFERLSGAVSGVCGPGDTEHPQFLRWNTTVLIAV